MSAVPFAYDTPSPWDEDPSDLYRAHVGVVMRYLEAEVGHDLGEELTVQTFVEAWARRHTFEPEATAFDAWLLDVAAHVLQRHLRRRHRLARRARVAGGRPVSVAQASAWLTWRRGTDPGR
ncbi:MAG TPA: sigma factor [Acidimicrobiales bacterium]|nr:sigma factor [Acidimicrobiales bacterium]